MTRYFVTSLLLLVFDVKCSGATQIFHLAGGPPQYAFSADALPKHKSQSNATDSFTMIQDQLQSQMHMMKQRQEDAATKTAQVQKETQSIAEQEQQQKVEMEKLENDGWKLSYVQSENDLEKQRLADLAQASDERLKPLQQDLENAKAEATSLDGKENAEIDALQQRITEAIQKKTTVESSVPQTTDVTNNIDEKYIRAQDTYTSIKDQFMPMQAEYIALRRENHQNDDRVATLQKNIDLLKARESKMTDGIRHMTMDKKRAVAANKGFKTNTTSTKNDLQKFEGEVMRVNSQKDDLQKVNQEMHRAIKNAKSNAQRLNLEIENSTSQLRRFMATATSLSDKNAILQKTISDTEAQISSFRQAGK